MKRKLLAGLGLTAALALALVVGAETVVALGNGPPVNVNPKTTVIIDYVSPEFGGPQHPGPHGNGEEDEEPTPTPEPTHDDHFTFLGGVWADANTATPEVDPQLAFQIDLRGFPAGSDQAILAAFASWESVTKGDLLATPSFNNVVVDFGDDINTYSMRNLGGRVLAATFITYDDANDNDVLDAGDVFLEMDVVFNSTVKWAIDPDGEGPQTADANGKWFDVENVAAHEDGHVFGMGHVGNGIHTLDRDKEQTMFVSAAPEETKQRTLELDGDILGAQGSFLGYLAP